MKKIEIDKTKLKEGHFVTLNRQDSLNTYRVVGIILSKGLKEASINILTEHSDGWTFSDKIHSNDANLKKSNLLLKNGIKYKYINIGDVNEIFTEECWNS